MCRREELDETQFVRFRQLVEDEEEVDVNCTGKPIKREITPSSVVLYQNKYLSLSSPVQFTSNNCGHCVNIRKLINTALKVHQSLTICRRWS